MVKKLVSNREICPSPMLCFIIKAFFQKYWLGLIHSRVPDTVLRSCLQIDCLLVVASGRT